MQINAAPPPHFTKFQGAPNIFLYRGEAVLRNTCANGILVKKSTKYN